MPEAAFAVHGLGDDFLRDKPKFAQVAQDFLDFIGDARLVIHNAAFDMKFLNHELGRLGHKPMPMDRALDTVMVARRKFPGSPASLDALCRRFGIDNSGRTLHGALLDSELLAEVYLELIGGRQPDFGLSSEPAAPARAEGALQVDAAWRPRPRPKALPPRITEEEVAAHTAFVAGMGDGALWLQK
jgi:DNA polymerase-3 subunit epsilon